MPVIVTDHFDLILRNVSTYDKIESIPLNQFNNVIKFKKIICTLILHGHIIEAIADMFLGKIIKD